MAGIISGRRTDPGQRGSETVARSRALLSILVDLSAGRPVIALAGELDIATAPAVRTVCLDTFRSQRRPYIVVDLAGLSFCDCSGLNAFLYVHNWARADGGWVRLCRAGRHLHKVLGLTGLASTLHCYPTAADAFADVGRRVSDHREQEHP